MFIVNVAADVFQRKHNLRLEFPVRPTMSELLNTVESQYDVVARSSRPAGYPDVPYKVETFQVYDDAFLRWVDLYSPEQLTNGCQIYAFQSETVWTVDVQGTIPPPRDTLTWVTSAGSPRRARLAADAGIPPSMSEKLRSVFDNLDVGRKGYVNYTDIRSAFLRCDMEFTYATVGDLFNRADANHDGHITYDEWVRFAIDFPHIIDALYFRSRDLLPDRPYYHASETEWASRRRERALELQRYYDESRWTDERHSLQSEYDVARTEAERAKAAAAAAVARERQAFDKLLYAPSSPRRYFGRY
jgi:hypothetical protein